jgi:hypothetical protein
MNLLTSVDLMNWGARIGVFVLILTGLIIFLPSVGILPLPVEFTDMLTSMFSLIKLVRTWPILDEFLKGFNIYLIFLGFKITWNTLLFLVSIIKDFEFLDKLKI